MRNSTLTGAIGEAIVTLDLLTRYGVNVAFPAYPCRYDMLVDAPSGVYKVQCKVGRFDDRCSPATLKASFETPYSTSEVDVIAVVDVSTETIFYVPASRLVEGTKGVTIRFEESSRQSTGFMFSEVSEFPFETKGVVNE